MGTLLCPPFGCGLLESCCAIPLMSSSSSSSDDAPASGPGHRNPYKESFKALEADVMHANTLL